MAGRPAGRARATRVAHRRIEKIFKSDDLSGVGHRGARAGPAMEMARLFQTELEHYEKVEGRETSPWTARPTSSAR